MSAYILVTPCKNEGENLPNLVLAIKAQSIKPKLWVIVDDGSSDNTSSVISAAQSTHEWIYSLNLPERPGYMGKHIAYVCNQGFNFAIEHCKRRNVHYDFIGLIDADNIPEKNYFEKLIKEFEKDPTLGIASGISAYADVPSILKELREKKPHLNVISNEFWALFGSSKVQIQKAYYDKPMGSARLWRSKCFHETGGGYQITHAPDAVSNVKAKMRGWETKRFNNAKVIERRITAVEGDLKGGMRLGKIDYFLGRPPYYSLLRSAKFGINNSPLYGIGYMYGILTSMINGEKIGDPEVLEYYKIIRIRELKEYYTCKLKQNLNLGRERK
jgi:glycosyltransferase involved in cell wall biosynthesis